MTIAKICFGLLIVIHGAIHLMGFFKAMGSDTFSPIKTPISFPLGLLWLFSCVLFLLAGFFLLVNRDSWPLLLLVAAVLSQLLIISVWKDARFGSLANLLIVLISLPAWGTFRQARQVSLEQAEFLKKAQPSTSEVLTEVDLQNLPTCVKRWLRYSNVIGKSRASVVSIHQKGLMKTKPDGKWMPFTAVQYVNPQDPGFIWVANVKMLPMIYLQGRDRLQAGEAEMKIRLLGWFDVVNEHHNQKVNSGSMIRFLGELCWYPSAAISPYISWKELSHNSAEAMFSYNETEVQGLFTFSENGALQSFKARRYYGGGKNARQEDWLVQVLETQNFDGLQLPSLCEVSWKFKEGDFTWLRLEIESLDINNLDTFKSQKMKLSEL